MAGRQGGCAQRAKARQGPNPRSGRVRTQLGLTRRGKDSGPHENSEGRYANRKQRNIKTVGGPLTKVKAVAHAGREIGGWRGAWGTGQWACETYRFIILRKTVPIMRNTNGTAARIAVFWITSAVDCRFEARAGVDAR